MEPLSSSDRRVDWFDLLRIISAFGVILLHVSAQNWHEAGIYSSDWMVFTGFDSAVRWCLPMFVMISGALFLERDIPLEVMYRKYILRIVTAFLFWSALYTLYSAVTVSHGPDALLARFLHGYYHLWFLYMIAGLYIVCPILRQIVRSETLERYFLALSLVFAFLLPQIMDVLGMPRNAYTDYARSLLSGMLENLQLHLVVGYSAYFLLGRFLVKTELSPGTRYGIYALGVLAAVSTMLLTAGTSHRMGERQDLFYNYCTLNVLLESLAAFVLAKYALGRVRLSDRARRIVRQLSACTFGVYLVHPLILNLLGLAGLTTFSFTPFLSIPVITILTTLLSLGISWLLNRVPKLKKYIV